MKTLIEVHVLQHHAPSNLNRDETGSPKEVMFGGIKRARLSSQCQKRAVRDYFPFLVENQILTLDELALRTKRLHTQLTEDLISLGRNPEPAAFKAEQALATIKLPLKKDGKNEYLLFIGQRERQKLVHLIDVHWDSFADLPLVDEDAPPIKGKTKKEKKPKTRSKALAEFHKEFTAMFNGQKTIDIALFGRMLVDIPEHNQTAACQVAHAISTNAFYQEFDFFTALDDLQPPQESGSAMMGTQEFTSACFYRYANVHWEQLLSNLDHDFDTARRALHAFLQGFIMATPTGKQNGFAAHNPPEFIVITVRRQTTPCNLANAFERPISPRPQESLTALSSIALLKHHQVMQDAFGTQGMTIVLNLSGTVLPHNVTEASTLDTLIACTLQEVQEKAA